jgi:hypothetical protein
MPSGGGYAVTSTAAQRLAASIRIEAASLVLAPDGAMPSYCSGATYHVFLEVLAELTRRGTIQPSPELLRALLVRGQPDGHGIWGRWNANGPGTAKLFADAQLGQNFTDWTEARPGDFLKVFWSSEIGHRERGHLVVYLGSERTSGGEHVIFWSSNQPDGYGRKSVPRSKIPWAIFSRFEHPQNLERLAALPQRDSYLADMLKRASSQKEVGKLCRIR